MLKLKFLATGTEGYLMSRPLDEKRAEEGSSPKSVIVSIVADIA